MKSQPTASVGVSGVIPPLTPQRSLAHKSLGLQQEPIFPVERNLVAWQHRAAQCLADAEASTEVFAPVFRVYVVMRPLRQVPPRFAALPLRPVRPFSCEG